MTKIPENSASESPDDLQETTYTCDCGKTFETAQKLGDHTVDCPAAQIDEEDVLPED